MIIIGYVNYNCSDSINSSIISVGDNAMCVVCDNSGNYNNIYNVKVVCPKSNIGLYNGFNYIIKSLSKINYNWFLASNPDIEYNYDFFNQLKKNKNKHQVIAPSIISNLTGHNQNPQILKRPTKMKMKIYSLIWNNYYLGVLYIYISFLVRKLKTKVGDTNISNKIYCPHGSLVIYSKFYLDNNNGLEHPTVLFGETIEIAEKCRINKIDIIFRPTLKVFHAEHVTTGLLRPKNVMKLQGESAKYYYDKYWN